VFKKPLVLEIILLFVLVATLDILARIYHLYWSVYEFDSVVHFFAGTCLALFFLWLYFFSGFFNPQKRNLRSFLLISILGVMFVGISWEIFELIFKQTMVQKVDYPYDLFMDLLMDFLGAVTGCLYALMKEESLKKILPMEIK
jgi:membrane protease YdiL (CAAX protease family)